MSVNDIAADGSTHIRGGTPGRFRSRPDVPPPGLGRDAAFEFALEVLHERRDEFRDQHFVPRDFVDLLKLAGVYRAAVPAQFGGEPTPPAEFLELVERISRVDPATGWVASFGATVVYLAPLPIDSQKAIYSHGPDITYAGAMFPMQDAERVDGGYILDGTWQFASGCRAADLIGVGLTGGPDSNGRPLTALLDPSDVEIVDNWDVAGMRSTGSHAVRVKGVFVPDEMTFVRGGEPLVNEPLFRYPSLAYAAQLLAVVALGAARGALDHMCDAGAVKTSVTGGASKGARPSFKDCIARSEADVRSARAFFYEATTAVWKKAVAERPITEADRNELRLAATHAAHVGRRAVLSMFDLAGTAAIYESHPLQRYVQDSLVPAQHAMLQTHTYEAAGSVILGQDPELPSFP
ncbi:acyl-CoA dehydrogenase family protein [Rhodococcus sp. USK13]|uniref:acyl-CoA dehydrogenase family protein n=1 Tax=Rhodococcus sp. USK13 TaxID=2806442 RepID=UPI001BD08CF0|nr:acyl-CoA dehydrogenase family protein [Rhodococcus sp. USK13]